MANKGRGYAENLVGQLDRSYFDPQRTVAQQTYNTNWENVQNQYNKLQDKLKRKQQQANTEFAEGLGTVASNSYDRMRQGILTRAGFCYKYFPLVSQRSILFFQFIPLNVAYLFSYTI